MSTVGILTVSKNSILPPPPDQGSRVSQTLETPPMTPSMLHILLAIAGGAQHGYGIMSEVAERTGGATELGAGTLYRSIKKMLETGLIEEADTTATNTLGPARREYRITERGRVIAAAEVEQLHDIVEWARAARLVDPREAV